MEHPRSPLGLVEIDAGTCTGCETCVSECPTGALFSERFNQNLDIKFDPCLCSACGKCVNVCPEKDNDAIKVNQTTDLESLSLGISRLFRDEEASCRRCGAPVAPRAMLERIAVLLGDEYVPELMQKLCVDCRAIG